MASETGWLVELSPGNPMKPVVWLSLHGYFTKDSGEAMRFARKVDAEAYMNLHGYSGLPLEAIEHMWSD